jgi:hypothetical protein
VSEPVSGHAIVRHARRRDELPPSRWRKSIWLVLVIVCAVPVMLALPRVLAMRTCCGESPYDRTALHLRRLAYEGFPLWSAKHDDVRCPTIRELDNEVSHDPDNVRDAWHQPIEIRCGDPLPNGAHGIWLRSAGPDGEFGTDDDLTSAD